MVGKYPIHERWQTEGKEAQICFSRSPWAVPVCGAAGEERDKHVTLGWGLVTARSPASPGAASRHLWSRHSSVPPVTLAMTGPPRGSLLAPRSRLALRCCPGQRAGGAFPSHCGGERFSEWDIVRGTGGSFVVKKDVVPALLTSSGKECEPNVPVCVYTHTHAHARTHLHTRVRARAHGGKEGPGAGRTQSRETWWSEKEGLGCNLWHHLSF